ncbi:MAG: lysophospholipid acyltransferase family protein [Myxococcales bacterium]|nr:lysophospholipid acyltransferase family protein [Myxococcales bacterium]MCB9577273.1 lysophospholipid acyltransferase family protein [Polyangiaceae bacterium]
MHALTTRDRRVGGEWTAPQQVKNTLIVWLVRALLAVVDRVPPRVLVPLGGALGWLTGVVTPTTRRTTARDLSRVLQRETPTALRCYTRAGENLALCLLLRRPSIAARELVAFDPESERELRSVLSRGRGCVFVSAHVGPFEAVAALVAELGLDPAVVVRESYDARLDPIVDAHRIGRGVEVIHRGRPGAAARLLRALRQGRPVGILPDLGGRVASEPAELCGQRVDWPIGPQRVALRTGAPVIVGVLERTTSHGPLPRFRLVLKEVSAGNEVDLTQRVTNAVSSAILRSPADWLWMSGRFSTPPSLNGSLHKNTRKR